MELYYRDVDHGVLVLSADGGLNDDTVSQFVGGLGRVVDSGADRVIVDCSRLGYVSASGVRILARLHGWMASRGGDVKVANVASHALRLLELAHVNRLFDIYPTVGDALRAFGEEPSAVAH